MGRNEPMLLLAMPGFMLLFALGLACFVLWSAPHRPGSAERCAAIGMDFTGNSPWFSACVSENGQYFAVPDTLPTTQDKQ